MNAVLEQVLADLHTEGDVLDDLVRDLDEGGWRASTPAAGWDVATTVVHLAWTDEAAIAAGTDKEAWDALVLKGFADPAGFVDAEAFAGAEKSSAEIHARWTASRPALAAMLRAVPDGQKLPWFGPPMSPTSMATARFMETWAHTLDVADALAGHGRTRPTPTDTIKHVAHLGVRTRNFAYGVHGEEPPADEFRVELTAPSGAVWSWGPDDAAQSVTGSAYDFCLLVTQRVHRADTDLVATGPDAEHWLSIAQAFAGPSGTGRDARG